MIAMLAITCTAPPNSAMAQDYIALEPGRQNFVMFDDPVVRVAVGIPQVATATSTAANEVRILAVAPGQTDISVWTQGATAPDGVLDRFDYSIRVVPDVGSFRSLVARQPGLGDVTVTLDGTRVLLGGTAANEEAYDNLLSIARGYFEDGFIDVVTIAESPMVAVDVRFYAVSTSAMQALGINLGQFGNTVQSAITAPGTAGDFAFGNALSLESSLPLGDAFNLFLGVSPADLVAILSALNRHNLAQVLAEPTLLVRSGQTATFLAGGEVPIPIAQQDSVTIEYREFGVRLELEADIRSRDRIVMRIAPEVSELDFVNAVTLGGTRVPALRRRSTDTVIELGDGQSFVLAGLFLTSTSDIDERMPLLGDIPVLGALFRRTETTQQSQELIVVATPRLVRPLQADEVPDIPMPTAVAPTVGEWLGGANPVRDAMPSHGLMR